MPLVLVKVIQLFVLMMVQTHRLVLLVKLTIPLVAPNPRTLLMGEILNVQGKPSWSTVKT